MPQTPENCIKQAERLNNSYHRWCGEYLVQGDLQGEALAEALAKAPFGLLSHGTESDPLFNYGNHCALHLFEIAWDQLIGMPSRKSAEPMNREDRALMLSEVKTQGFSTSYQGVRISAKGNRFLITKSTIWNLVGDDGAYVGQAAKLDEWAPL